MGIAYYVIFRREFVFVELKPIPKKKEDAPSVVCEVFSKQKALDILDSMSLEKRANCFIKKYITMDSARTVIYESVP